jgi:AhpD family alkylhydroperoxidase
MKTFRKRVLNVYTFFNECFSLFKNFGALKIAFRRKLIDSSFRERIMLAVTQVNQCRFCSFGHTHAALSTGISSNEIKEILDANFNNVPENQQLALCFAQNFAESKGIVEVEYLNRLNSYYGIEKSQDILTFARFMTFCNLCGNTLDAFLIRFKGKRIENSFIFNEIMVVIFMILLLPLIFIAGLLFK